MEETFVKRIENEHATIKEKFHTSDQIVEKSEIFSREDYRYL